MERDGASSGDDIIYAVTSSTGRCPAYDVSLADVCRQTTAGSSDDLVLPVLRILTTSDGYMQHHPLRTRTLHTRTHARGPSRSVSQTHYVFCEHWRSQEFLSEGSKFRRFGWESPKWDPDAIPL